MRGAQIANAAAVVASACLILNAAVDVLGRNDGGVFLFQVPRGQTDEKIRERL
jgi:hypothetical protein